MFIVLPPLADERSQSTATHARFAMSCCLEHTYRMGVHATITILLDAISAKNNSSKIYPSSRKLLTSNTGFSFSWSLVRVPEPPDSSAEGSMTCTGQVIVIDESIDWSVESMTIRSSCQTLAANRSLRRSFYIQTKRFQRTTYAIERAHSLNLPANAISDAQSLQQHGRLPRLNLGCLHHLGSKSRMARTISNAVYRKMPHALLPIFITTISSTT